MTVEEFEQYIALPENDGRRLQLVNGEIVEKFTTINSSRIKTRLVDYLGKYAERSLNWLALMSIDVHIPDDNYNFLVPDLAVIDKSHTIDPNEALPFISGFIVEIQPKGQSDHNMLDLANYYLANGCRMVWLIYPDRKLVEWLTPNERRLLTAEDVINGGDIFPDISLTVAAIFAAE